MKKFYEKFEYEILMVSIPCGAMALLWVTLTIIKHLILWGHV